MILIISQHSVYTGDQLVSVPVPSPFVIYVGSSRRLEEMKKSEGWCWRCFMDMCLRHMAGKKKKKAAHFSVSTPSVHTGYTIVKTHQAEVLAPVHFVVRSLFLFFSIKIKPKNNVTSFIMILEEGANKLALLVVSASDLGPRVPPLTPLPLAIAPLTDVQPASWAFHLQVWHLQSTILMAPKMTSVKCKYVYITLCLKSSFLIC